MSLKKTLLLALLVLGIGLYVKYFELPREEQKQTEQELLKGLRRQNIKSLEIVVAGEDFKLVNGKPEEAKKNSDDVELANDDLAAWQLSDLPGAKLEAATLSALFSALEQLRLDSSIPKGDVNADLSVYGLDKPVVQIKLEDVKGQFEIKLGKQNEYISKRYLKLTGRDELYLIGESLFSAANKSKKDFRDPTPIEFLDSQLASITVKDSLNQIKFEAGDKAAWNIVEPIKKMASSSALSELNMNLRNLSVLEFIDSSPLPLAEKQLDPAEATITLEFKADLKRPAEQIRLRSFKEKVGDSELDRAYLYLKDGPSIFKLAANPLSKIIKPVDAWREKKMFKFVSDQVAQADFQLEDGTQLGLLKGGDEWQVNGKPADAVFVRDLLRNLSELEAVDFPLENMDFGFNLPTLKVIVRLSTQGADKPQDKTLVVGSRVGNDKSTELRYYASVDDMSDVFIIKKETLDRIKPKEEALLKPTPAATSIPIETSKP